MNKATELKQAKDDLAYWETIFHPLGCIVTGWTYRNHCQIRLPSGTYLSVDRKILELIGCFMNKAETRG